MKCPTPCHRCGDEVELHDLHFRTTLCRCDELGSDHCDHGVCDDCLDDILTGEGFEHEAEGEEA